MKLAVSSLVTSSAIAWSRSGAKALHLCWTGFLSGSMFNLYWMIFGDMPSMSSWLHAKTSRFSLRNSMAWSSSQGLASSLFLSSWHSHLQPVLLFPKFLLYSLPLQLSMYGSPSWPGQPSSILWLKFGLLLPCQLRYLLGTLISDNRWTLSPSIC